MAEPLACLDAAYADDGAGAACVLFAAWDAAEPLGVLTTRQGPAQDYVPGAFYRRELPLLVAVLEQLDQLPGTIIVDGHVWLDAQGRPGLGAMLHRALGGRAAVVGVAKASFAGAAACVPVLRGGSQRPLYVSTAGCDAAEAASRVRAMHGRHRIPTMLRLADRSARAILA